MPLRIAFVAGARPNFPKIAPILAALRRHEQVEPVLVHTGQHYDPELSAMFFEDLGISEPDWMLGVGSGSHAVQTARVMVAFEERLLASPVDAIVVVGDVNSTVACALVGTKLHIPVIHVEAGLRSGDRSMPEEINRVVTDSISDLLYTHCEEADANLAREGIAPDQVEMVGNVMIDSLLRMRGRAQPPQSLGAELPAERSFGLVTLHRPALVDHAEALGPMLDTLRAISADLPLLYPVHPRTLARMRSFGFVASDSLPVELPGSRLRLCAPLRYLEFLWLMDRARLVITDSGGIQEETTVLGVPCLTVRENTERAVTIHAGTNRLVGVSAEALREAAADALRLPLPGAERVPPLWDGRAGERIADHLVAWLARRRAGSPAT